MAEGMNPDVEFWDDEDGHIDWIDSLHLHLPQQYFLYFRLEILDSFNWDFPNGYGTQHAVILEGPSGWQLLHDLWDTLGLERAIFPAYPGYKYYKLTLEICAARDPDWERALLMDWRHGEDVWIPVRKLITCYTL
jgi:hypothetical protein